MSGNGGSAFGAPVGNNYGYAAEPLVVSNANSNSAVQEYSPTPLDVLADRIRSKTLRIRDAGLAGFADPSCGEKAVRHTLDYLFSRSTKTSKGAGVMKPAMSIIAHDTHEIVRTHLRMLDRVFQWLAKQLPDVSIVKQLAKMIQASWAKGDAFYRTAMHHSLTNNPEMAAALHLLATFTELYDVDMGDANATDANHQDLAFERERRLIPVVMCGALRQYFGSGGDQLVRGTSCKQTPLKALKTVLMDTCLSTGKLVNIHSTLDMPLSGTSFVTTNGSINSYPSPQDTSKIFTALQCGNDHKRAVSQLQYQLLGGVTVKKIAAIVKQPWGHFPNRPDMASGMADKISELLSALTLEDVAARLETGELAARSLADYYLEFLPKGEENEHVVDPKLGESDTLDMCLALHTAIANVTEDIAFQYRCTIFSCIWPMLTGCAADDNDDLDDDLNDMF